MTTTISASLILVKHEMDQENKTVCQPAIALGVKCHYPHMCKHVSIGDNAIFYCKLHFLHGFLENFQHFLSVKVSAFFFSFFFTFLISERKETIFYATISRSFCAAQTMLSPGSSF